jgi:hypothetical protein
MLPGNDWLSSAVRDYHTWTAASHLIRRQCSPRLSPQLRIFGHPEYSCSFHLSLLVTTYSLPRHAHESSALYPYRRRTSALIQVKAAYCGSLVRSTASALCYLAWTCINPHSLPFSTGRETRLHKERTTIGAVDRHQITT